MQRRLVAFKTTEMNKCAFIAFIASVLCISLAKAAGETAGESINVHTIIISRLAETVITSKVINDKNVSQKINFKFLLPKEAFISGFSMTIDGRTYDAIVEEKVKARRTFEIAVERNKTAGIVETRKQSRKTFKTSVNIEAGATVKFRLVYQQLLRKIRGRFQHQLILLGSQLTRIETIRVDICESQEILEVDTLPILDSQGRNVPVNPIVDHKKTSARIDFLKGQIEAAITALSTSGGSFVVEYVLAPIQENGQAVVNDRYLIYYYPPPPPAIKIQPKRVIFTLDASGSMYGQKIRQLKEAMINITSKLTEEDRFTIVTFQNRIRVWKYTLTMHAATQQNIKDAQEFINAMAASGGTNIDGALQVSLYLLNNEIEHSDPSNTATNYIVFLTDGKPTAGERDTNSILRKIDSNNKNKVPIHAIGFGTEVDVGFLKSLAARNNGSWTQVFEDTHSALQIQNYLDELSTPLTGEWVNISYPAEVFDKVIDPPTSSNDDDERVAYMRFKKRIKPSNRSAHFIKLIRKSKSKKKQQIPDEIQQHHDKPLNCTGLYVDANQHFGKLFALAEVTEILRLYNAESDATLKKKLKRDAVNKSIEAGLVTPVTSLLVIKPEDRREIDEEFSETENTTTTTTTTSTTTTLGQAYTTTDRPTSTTTTTLGSKRTEASSTTERPISMTTVAPTTIIRPVPRGAVAPQGTKAPGSKGSVTPKKTKKPRVKTTAPPNKSRKPASGKTVTPKRTKRPGSKRTAAPKKTKRPSSRITNAPTTTRRPSSQRTAAPKRTRKPGSRRTATPKKTKRPSSKTTASPITTKRPASRRTAAPKRTRKPGSKRTDAPNKTKRPESKTTAPPGKTRRPASRRTADPTSTRKLVTPAKTTLIPLWQILGDPHVVVQLSNSVTACFNWMGKNGEVDAEEVVVMDTASNAKRPRDLYLPMQNVNTYETTFGPVAFQISNVTVAHTILNITVSHGISFIVNLHHPRRGRIKDEDHLDLMISGSKQLSQNVGGLFGQFPREPEELVSIETSGTRSFLWFRNRVTPVTNTSMTVPYLRRKISCWFIAKPEEIIGWELTSFGLKGLYQIPEGHSPAI